MVCLDTTFIIDLLRGKKEIKLLIQKFNNLNEDLTISPISIKEVIYGVYASNKIEEEKEKIESLLNSFIMLNFDKESAFLAGKIEFELDKTGKMIDTEDIMIASTAIANEETLITRNKKHFERIKELKAEYY